MEISRGDLSKAWSPRSSSSFHDEIDDLTEAIRTMQENLRDLVSRIQRTAQSVAESANELQTSAEEVNASTDEVATSMEKIAEGAGQQSDLVERTSKVIGDIAASIERTARSAEEAARASRRDQLLGGHAVGEAARLAGEKVKKVFARIEAASEQVFAFGERTKEISKIVEVITIGGPADQPARPQRHHRGGPRRRVRPRLRGGGRGGPQAGRERRALRRADLRARHRHLRPRHQAWSRPCRSRWPSWARGART